MPPTTALDYKYTVKHRDEKKITINTYELGGGRQNSSMIQACASAESLTETTFCICVDLSKPGNSIESALYWMQAVRE